MGSSVLLRGESDKERKIWVEKVLLLSRCFCGPDKEGNVMAIVKIVRCLPFPNAVDDSLKCVSLRWAAPECGKNDLQWIGWRERLVGMLRGNGLEELVFRVL